MLRAASSSPVYIAAVLHVAKDTNTIARYRGSTSERRLSSLPASSLARSPYSRNVPGRQDPQHYGTTSATPSPIYALTMPELLAWAIVLAMSREGLSMSKSAYAVFFAMEILGISLGLGSWLFSPVAAKVDPLEKRVAALELQVQKLTIALQKPPEASQSFTLGTHKLAPQKTSPPGTEPSGTWWINDPVFQGSGGGSSGTLGVSP